MTILDINIAKGIVITKYMTIYVTIHYNTKRILSYIVSIVTNCHVLSCIVNNIARVWFADGPCPGQGPAAAGRWLLSV